jgi:hypothetical protein
VVIWSQGVKISDEENKKGEEETKKEDEDRERRFFEFLSHRWDGEEIKIGEYWKECKFGAKILDYVLLPFKYPQIFANSNIQVIDKFLVMGVDLSAMMSTIRQIAYFTQFPLHYYQSTLDAMKNSSSSDLETAWYTQNTLNKKEYDRILVFTEDWVSNNVSEGESEEIRRHEFMEILINFTEYSSKSQFKKYNFVISKHPYNLERLIKRITSGWFYIPLPWKSLRQKYLKNLFKNLSLNDLESLAEATEGFIFDDFEKLAQNVLTDLAEEEQKKKIFRFVEEFDTSENVEMDEKIQEYIKDHLEF